MAGQAKRTRLNAVITDGTLTIPEVEGEWQHDPHRTFWVEVSDLRLSQVISTDYDVITRSPNLTGTATIRRDRIQLAGWGDTCRALSVTIRPAIPQDDGNGYTPFTGVLGFILSDWELKIEDTWFLECWIPEVDMASMLAAYRAGEMPSCHLGMKLDLWIAKDDQYTPIGYGVTWYLAPSEGRPSESPEVARGNVLSLRWTDDPRPKVEEDDRAPAQPPAIQPALAPRLAPVDHLVSPHVPTPAPVEPPPNADVASLTAAVERLRSTVLLVGLAIAAALVVSWFV